MFTPRELEGEVDHSFFDSDSECPSISKDATNKEEKKEEAAVNTLLPDNSGPRPPPEAGQEGCVDPGPPGPPGPRSHLEKTSRASSSSSIGYTSDDVSRNGADAKRPERNPGDTPKAPSSDEEEESDGEDGYYQSRDESEEEQEEQTRLSRKSSGVNLTPPKKLVRKRQTRSMSPSSSSTDTDTTSDSSDASPPLAAKPGGFASSSPRGVNRPPTPPLGESEDTATDVTPMSTPDLVSPVPGSDPAAGVTLGVRKVTLGEEQPIRGPSSVASSDAPPEDQDFGSHVDERSLSVDSQLVAELLFQQQQPARPNSRKNFSFSNNEVRRIERENQRLLRELSRRSPRPTGATAPGRTHAGNPPPPVRVSHSALNRQRQQQRIERENLAFLKKLEGVKATPGLRRTDQLADHHRQAAYLGPSPSPSTSSSTSSTPLFRPTSRTAAAKGLSTAGAGHRRTRTPERDRSTTNTTHTHVPRSK